MKKERNKNESQKETGSKFKLIYRDDDDDGLKKFSLWLKRMEMIKNELEEKKQKGKSKSQKVNWIMDQVNFMKMMMNLKDP